MVVDCSALVTPSSILPSYTQKKPLFFFPECYNAGMKKNIFSPYFNIINTVQDVFDVFLFCKY